jgi:hypothetical protein
VTDRLKGCVVVFEHDIRDDDAAPLLAAIKQMKGVVEVSPSLSTSDDWFAQTRVRQELGTKLLKILYPDMYKENYQ